MTEDPASRVEAEELLAKATGKAMTDKLGEKAATQALKEEFPTEWHR